jgi:glycosyltransferase involved in cell wall biosynthesis
MDRTLPREAESSTRALRVVMVVDGFPTADDPATGVFNLRAARALKDRANVTVVHLRSWRPGRAVMHTRAVDDLSIWTLAVPQIPVLHGLSREVYRLMSWPAVKRLLSECDVIHSVGFAFAGVVGAHWSRLARVHHVTQITSEVELNVDRLRPSAHALRFIHGVACNSETLAAHFHVLYPSADNVRAVYRGVDLRHFTPQTFTSDSTAGVRFLFLGGFPEYQHLPHGRNTKGGETLLEAWKTAEAELANASAQLVIGGPRSTDKAVQRWRAGLRYPERVQLAGNIQPADVLRYIQSCDAVLVPSLQEGFPNVALEAAACGRTVLASKLDGIAELVVHGETGALVPPGDARSWASALTQYAQRRDDLHAFGRNARSRAENYFDANAYPENMVDLYHAALREPLERSL